MNKYWFENEYCKKCPYCIKTSDLTKEECEKFWIIGNGRAERWPYSCRLFGFAITFDEPTSAGSSFTVYTWWKETIGKDMKNNNPQIRIVITADDIVEYDLRDCPYYTYDLVWKIDEDLSVFQAKSMAQLCSIHQRSFPMRSSRG